MSGGKNVNEALANVLSKRESDLLDPLSDAFLVLFEAWFVRRDLTKDEQQQVANIWALVQARKSLIEVANGTMD